MRVENSIVTKNQVRAISPHQNVEVQCATTNAVSATFAVLNLGRSRVLKAPVTSSQILYPSVEPLGRRRVINSNIYSVWTRTRTSRAARQEVFGVTWCRDRNEQYSVIRMISPARFEDSANPPSVALRARCTDRSRSPIAPGQYFLGTETDHPMRSITLFVTLLGRAPVNPSVFARIVKLTLDIQFPPRR